ncbi:LOW QUALITY PROTEIN: zinc finger BED domain-containing protein 4-like [Rhinophrynus dorsalis]
MGFVVTDGAANMIKAILDGSKSSRQSQPIPKSIQATLEDFGGFNSKGICRQQSRKITRLIAQLIAVGGATFSLVDGEPFHQLMEVVAPRYKIPSCTTFSRTIVPSLYKSCVGLLKELLGKAGGQSVHFTTDLWSAPSGQHGFLSLTAHWWQPNVLKDTLIATTSSGAVAKQAGDRSFLLHAEVMDQQHTSDNIRKALQNMVAQWLGEQAGTQVQMGFVVTDGAANMIKALRDGRFVGVRCSAHVLHLVVKAALEDGSNTGRLSALLESCQISGHFHQSVKDSQLLREEQKKADLPEHRLKQDVGTRWNSTLDMLECILEQKKTIHTVSCHRFIGSNRTLGRADWALMEQVVTVLTPFRALMELLSKENASLAEVIPLFTHLSLKLDDFLSHRERLPGAEGNILPDVAALLTRLKKELTRRMEERMDNCPELMLATICDPRIKGKLALCSNSLTAWREQLIARVRERQRKTRMQSQEVGEDSEDELEECGEEVGWNDEALVAAFAQGLCDRIKDETAARDLPNDLDEIIDYSILIDSRIRERMAAKDCRQRARELGLARQSFPPMPPSPPMSPECNRESSEQMQ